MAIYSHLGHRNSLDRTAFARELEDNDRSYLEMETVSDTASQGQISIFIVFVFILETLVLIFVVVLEYFLRFTDVFPVRHLNFSCVDPSISHVTEVHTFNSFAYYADIPFEAVVSCCFCITPILILVTEVSLWAFNHESQKTVYVLCTCCKMPQVIRRIIRYIGTFLLGLLLTAIFADVMKIMTGRLRPTFLETCQPNRTECGSGGIFDENICEEKNLKVIREARLSFPSMQASITSFAGVFTAIYLHASIRSHGVRLMRPFIALAFILLSVMCCLSRYGNYYNHWEDVLAGFILGAVFALYICIFGLHNFRERMNSKKLYSRLRTFMHEQRALELRDLYKEERLERLSYFGAGPAYPSSHTGSYSYSGNLTIPRPQMKYTYQLNSSHSNANGESNTDDLQLRETPVNLTRGNSNASKLRQQNTFQRDLQKTLDQYRSGGSRDGYDLHM